MGKNLKILPRFETPILPETNHLSDALKKEISDAAEKKKQVLMDRLVPLPNLSGMSKLTCCIHIHVVFA